MRAFASPSRYYQGPGLLGTLGIYVKHLGTSAGVVLTPGNVDRIGPTIQRTLDESDISSWFIPFGGECSHQEIDRIRVALEPRRPAFVVGAGGGKALDTAKAVANTMGLPVVILPTIAATDSPTAASSVVYTPDGEFIEEIPYSTNPAIVLVDSELIAHAPVRYLVSGMGDALATRFEARACLRSGASTFVGGQPTALAGAIAELCYQIIVADGPPAAAHAAAHRVTPALERVIEANVLLSGLGWESAGMAAAHSIHNGLTTIPGTRSAYHGELVAFATIAQLVIEDSDDEAEEIARFCFRMGMPVRLGQLGADPNDRASLLAAGQKACALGESIHNMPRPISAEVVAESIRRADEIGQRVTAQAAPQAAPKESEQIV